MEKPGRFQAVLYRRLPPGEKLVGRSTRWGNPYPVRGTIDPEKPPRFVRHCAEKGGLQVEAKREETRARCIRKILPMIASGIGLNDRYRC